MATAKAGFASGLVFTPPLVAQWMPRPVVVDITPAAGAYKFILIKAQE